MHPQVQLVSDCFRKPSAVIDTVTKIKCISRNVPVIKKGSPGFYFLALDAQWAGRLVGWPVGRLAGSELLVSLKLSNMYCHPDGLLISTLAAARCAVAP